MSKFDNVRTTANVAIITVDENGTPKTELKSVAIPYTRKTEKAVVFAKEALKLDDNATVAVIAIEHEKPDTVRYNMSKVVENAIEIFNDEKTARELEESGNVKVFVVPEYKYIGQVWAISEEGKYTTKKFEATGYNAYTKANLRGFVKMRYEMAHEGSTVLGLHDCKREQLADGYAVVPLELLEKCVANKRNSEDA